MIYKNLVFCLYRTINKWSLSKKRAQMLEDSEGSEWIQVKVEVILK